MGEVSIYRVRKGVRGEGVVKAKGTGGPQIKEKSKAKDLDPPRGEEFHSL